jgi:hypothetical protein
LAGQYIQSLNNLKKSEPIIKAALESQNVSLYKKIGQAMDKYPKDFVWLLSLHTSPNQRNKTAERLFSRWMQLNLDNPHAGMGFYPATCSRSPQVIEACFNWIRAGGRKGGQMPFVLADLIGSAERHHKALFPRLVRFARAWLKANPNHEETGRVYARLFYATRSKSDISKAKQWHQNNQADQSAWHVIHYLLEDAYWYFYKPDQYAVDQAKILLRQDKFRHDNPRLVGALVGSSADDESIAWAKETYRLHGRRGHWWILIRILMRAPDEETIANAEKEYENWKDWKDEPQMIYALLHADQRNALALKRARVWTKREPNNKWIKAINPLIR